MNPIFRLFDKQSDYLYNLDMWVLLNWEVREETQNLFTVWRRNLVPDQGMQSGRIKHRANCLSLAEAFHYVEEHIGERDKP